LGGGVVTGIQRELTRIQGFGDCPAGYFEEDGHCYVQTQWLANPQGVPPTQYYPGIYGPPAVSPVGLPNLGKQLLQPGIRAAIIAAGHSVDCKTIKSCAGTVCDEAEMCSIDGGPYDRGAYALNANPGVLLVELGAKAPLFGPSGAAPKATAPGAAPQTGGGVVPTAHSTVPASHSAPIPKATPVGGPVIPGTGITLDPAAIGAALQTPIPGTSFPIWWALAALVGAGVVFGGRR
jgi:hypothetical protein